jgi:hypothetical protein
MGSWPLLVSEELIDVGFSKIRAHSIGWNSPSIYRFTKSGHEPLISKDIMRRWCATRYETWRGYLVLFLYGSFR